MSDKVHLIGCLSNPDWEARRLLDAVISDEVVHWTE